MIRILDPGVNPGVGPALDPALPALAAIFDGRLLSSLLPEPAFADRLRHKPGVSAIARLRARTSALTPPAGAEPPPGWLTAYAQGHEAKLEKTFRRAHREGHAIHTAEVPDDPSSLLVAGPIAMDPKLYRTLRPFAPPGAPLAFGPGDVLNYNPHRRVVFRLGTAMGTVVCKAGAGDPSEAAFLTDLASRGVPVLQRMDPEDAPRSAELRYYPWFGQGDLQRFAAVGRPGDIRAATRAAGAALAALHAQPARLARGPQHHPLHKLRLVATRNARLLPACGGRLEGTLSKVLAGVAADQRVGLVHGDFSADQVLVGTGEVLLSDFDRSTAASPGMDLGSFVAVDLLQEHGTAPLRGEFLEGYEAAGGSVPADVIRFWTAAHLLDRLDEPFRSCSPRWQTEMAERVDLLDDILA